MTPSDVSLSPRARAASLTGTALAMASSCQAACLGRGDTLGRLLPGRAADMVRLAAVRRKGERLG